VRVAESRFADSTHGAGARRRIAAGAFVDRATTDSGDGSGAPSRAHLLGALIALFGVLVLVLAFGTGSASAALRHTTVTGTIGENGPVPPFFGGRRAGAFHKEEQILYGATSNSMRLIQIPALGEFNLIGSPAISNSNANFATVDVDNSGGPRDGYFYLAPVQGPNSVIRGYTNTGEEMANFPINVGARLCGVSVDDEGFVWGGNNGTESVEKFDPATGGQVGAIGVSETGVPCGIEFDENTDDLYVRTESGPIYKYTKASNYQNFVQLTPPTPFNSKFTVNAERGILYVDMGQFLEAYTTDGEFVEKIEALGNAGFLVTVNPNDDTVYSWSGNGSGVYQLPVFETPLVITGEPVADSTVSGTVDEDGAGPITECYFEWGTNTNYTEADVPCSPAPPYGPNEPVTAVLPGAKEVTYHYRVVAANASEGGINKGADKVITPHFVPFLKTGPAENVERTTAELTASFDGNNEETKYYFEWGETTAYGSQSPEVVLPNPVGHTPLSFEATGLTAGKTYHYRIVAENPQGESKAEDRTFTTLPAVRNVSTDPPSGVTPTSATLNGKFDIDNEGGGNTSYYFEYGVSTAYGSETAPPPGHPAGATPGTVLPSKLVALNKGTTYHYRIVVTNELGTTFGADQEFTTPEEPAIASFTSSNVTASTADLIATINPNGAATTYRFEYGTSPAYGSVTPIPDGEVGSGEEPVQVSQHITNLEVGATYHFRVLAKNQWGEDVSVNQTFSFFTANCPNAYLRQQTGAAYLPDCRAYELVSPEVAGSVQLFPGNGLGPIVNEFIPHPQPSNRGLASSPARFAFWGGIGQITGTNPPNITQDLYVSTRGLDGWDTHYPGISASTSFAAGGTNCSDAMDRCVNYDVADPLELSVEDTGSNAPYVFDSEQNSVSIGRLPTMVEEIESGEEFTGEGLASGDYTHFAFSSNDVPFTEGGLEAAPGSAYDNDTAANTAEVISKTPGGLDIAQDPEGCQEGSPNTQRYCADEFIRIQALSTDGSHILLSNWAPPLSGEFPNKQIFADAFKRRDVHLTMRVPGVGTSYDITQGHRAHLVGMTRDGSKVIFTSDEQVTPDDTDSSVDVFMWEEGPPDTLTRLSSGNAGESGNTDECTVGWVTACGVQTVDATIDRFEAGEEEIYTPDNWFSENGELYFYSPEQLDGGNGLVGERNLYVYRNGAPQYVTTLSAARPAVRMNVAPDGDHVAFVTAEQITGYQNTGTEQMYVYEPAPDRISCASCHPTGAPPAGDAGAAQNGRFMSDDGRTFFSSKSALVPFDTNGLTDIYEYVDGRPQLISSGTANQDTWGGGVLIYPPMATGLEHVSADGVDVYFSTFDTLVPEDENGEFIKFYDARTGGGFPFAEPPPPCKAADECHGGGSVAPALPRVGTGAQLAQTGNVKTKKKKCRKGFVKKRGKCVKKKGGKKRKRAKGHRSRRNG
jgi:hypothetical protein